MPLRISIDPDRCMGSGSCTFHAPGTFDVGDDNVAVVLDPAGDPPDAVRRAADGCPTQAITVDDRSTDDRSTEDRSTDDRSTDHATADDATAGGDGSAGGAADGSVRGGRR